MKKNTFCYFKEYSPKEIKAEGFLLEFLERQQKGLSGNFKKHGYPFDGCMWTGKINNKHMRENVYAARDIPILEGSNWWPYEQAAYLLDGLERLGLLLDDSDLCDVFEENLAYLIDNPDSNGRLGGLLYGISSQWPMAVFFRAVIAYVEAKDDHRVKDAFCRHFHALSVEDLALELRHIVNIEGVLKCYEWSGDSSLLEKAEAAYQLHNEHFGAKNFFYKELFWGKFIDKNQLIMHGPSFVEELKLPVLLYCASGKAEYLEHAVATLEKIINEHGQANGIISCNEYLSGNDPLQGYETCVISDLTWTIGYFLMATGDCSYADRIERIIYNALPGSISKDFTSLQYLSGVNQVIADGFSHHTHFKRGVTDKWQYSPTHFPECCSGNVHRAMPNFILRMWLKDETGAPVAAFYGPSKIEFHYHGENVRICEKSNYPFEENISFIFEETSSEAMSFTFRIPEWCDSPSLLLNDKVFDLQLPSASFVTIPSRVWQKGDELILKLTMQPKIQQDRQWRHLEYGALIAAFPVANTVKKEGDKDFPALRIAPTGEWNYALAVQAEEAQEKVEVIHCPNDEYPFDNPPLRWLVPAQKISAYDALDAGRFTPEIPLFYQLYGEIKTLELLPFGATYTRIAAFPDTVTRKCLPVVSASVSGPYPYNRRIPLAEQIFEDEHQAPYKFIDEHPALVQFGANGYVDLISHFECSQDYLSYLQFRFWSEKAEEVTLALSVADEAIGWLNGEKVIEIEASREGELMAPLWFQVKVNAGYNFLMLKIADLTTPEQYRKAWGAKLEVFTES